MIDAWPDLAHEYDSMTVPPWLNVGVLILFASMVAVALVVGTQAFLETRAAGTNADRNHEGDLFRLSAESAAVG